MGWGRIATAHPSEKPWATEAGYAEGLGKPVIYTCDKSVFEDEEAQPHFDTNHHVTVLWTEDDPADFVRRLKATIRATIPDAKQEDGA